MTTPKNLIEAVMLDEYPSLATMVDFGIDIGGQQVYETYYHPIRNGEITEQDLINCIGDGPKLTELVNGCPSNRIKGIEIKTMWDKLC